MSFFFMEEPLFNQACNSLNDLAEEFWTNAKNHGFHDEPVPLATMLKNLDGEESELWEAYRDNKLDAPCDKSEKMKQATGEVLSCKEEEIADILIRTLDMAREFKVDIGRAVRVKHRYNQTRPHRHGGKIV